jgi:hypothetical protein
MAGQARACPAYQVWFAPKVWFPPALIPVHTLEESPPRLEKKKNLCRINQLFCI